MSFFASLYTLGGLRHQTGSVNTRYTLFLPIERIFYSSSAHKERINRGAKLRNLKYISLSSSSSLFGMKIHVQCLNIDIDREVRADLLRKVLQIARFRRIQKHATIFFV